MQGESEEDMKVITAVKKYLKSDREIFIQSKKYGDFISVPRDKDFYLEFGSVIAEAKVKMIDTEECDEAVTIYIA